MPVHRVEVFYIYPHEENTQFKEKKRMLDNHFSFIKRRNGVVWHEYKFQPGSNPTHEIELRLNRADIILFLLSADYYATGGYEAEAEVALSRERRGEARVIPIIFRSCAWETSDFGILSPLPKNGNGIFPRENEDEVCKEVQQGIDSVIDEWRVKQKVQPQIEKADSYFKQGAYEKALSLYDTTLFELEKTYFKKDIADLLRKIGIIQAKNNQREAALQNYEQAIQQSPYHPMLPIFYKEQGEILLDLRQWKAAIGVYDKAIDLIGVAGMEAIEASRLYENKGEAFIAMGRFGDALSAFDAANVLLRGIEIARSKGVAKPTSQDLQDGLMTISGSNAWQGVSGLIDFDENHEAINKSLITLKVSSEGYIQMVCIQGQFARTATNGLSMC